MTPSHTPESFAAWLRGFMDAIDGVPSVAQVEHIRGELAKVQAAPQTPEVKPAVAPFDWTKFWKDWQPYIAPVQPPPSYPYPWDTLPYQPWQPCQPTIIWTSDKVDPRWSGTLAEAVACGGVALDRTVCGGGIPQDISVTITGGATFWPGGWATNAHGTDSVQ